MKFINKFSYDVYVDLGGLKRISPGQVVDLPGIYKMDPLTPIMEEVPAPKKSKTKAKTKKTSTSGTI